MYLRSLRGRWNSHTMLISLTAGDTVSPLKPSHHTPSSSGEPSYSLIMPQHISPWWPIKLSTTCDFLAYYRSLNIYWKTATMLKNLPHYISKLHFVYLKWINLQDKYMQQCYEPGRILHLHGIPTKMIVFSSVNNKSGLWLYLLKKLPNVMVIWLQSNLKGTQSDRKRNVVI